MSARGGTARLKKSGQQIVDAPLTSRESNKDSNAEEKSSSSKPGKAVRQGREPQTARALLEENKVLVELKKEEGVLARKKSREFIDVLLASDAKILDADKAKNASRRLAQQELARYYKSRIAEKELEKACEYQAKRDAGANAQYFPYTEGEHINTTRKSQNALMREEMRQFLKEQESTKRHSQGRDMNGDGNYAIPYHESGSQLGGSATPASPGNPDNQSMISVGSKPPKFLMRPTEHMSRRVQDDHVRKTLEAQVEATKVDLEKTAARRTAEAQAFEEGMLVNDALRYDATQNKNSDLFRNAEYVKRQMKERKARKDQEVSDRRSEIAGYFGPEEKEIPGMTHQLDHSADLIKQMEVNQHRKLDSRSRRINQERRMVNNSLAEISQDRELEKQKLQLHKEVLVTTWDSQRKIKEVVNRIAAHA